MKSILIKKLHFMNNEDALREKIANNDFSPETGEGIRIIFESNEYLFCHYLIEKIYNQDIYNLITGELEKIELKRIDFIPFFIDFEQETLDIIGNKLMAIKVIEFIGKITKYKIAISDLQINMVKLVGSCKNNNIISNVSKIKIIDYVFFDNIIGDCTLNLTDYPNTFDILKKYEKQIVNVSISITYDNSYLITFHKSGSIKINKDIESIDINFLRLLKQGI